MQFFFFFVIMCLEMIFEVEKGTKKKRRRCVFFISRAAFEQKANQVCPITRFSFSSKSGFVFVLSVTFLN